LQNQVINVNLFGSFCVFTDTSDAEKFRMLAAKNRKVAALIEYLIIHRNRPVSVEQLMDTFWPDNSAGDPKNLLKYTIHRARTMLQDSGIENGRGLIETHGGSYRWSQQAEYRVDADEFDLLIKQFYSHTDEDSRMQAAEKAIALYTGAFLPEEAGSLWAVALNARYSSDFIGLCLEMARCYYDRGRWADAIEVCDRGISQEPTQEELHMIKMKCLMDDGREAQALAHYEKTTDMLLNQYFITPSEEMLALHKRISNITDQVELDLNLIQEKIVESQWEKGAYFCGQSVFREIYRVFARSMQRQGFNACVALMTMESDEADSLRKTVSGMERLQRTIKESLRGGDIFTKYSPTQFLILLHSASYEDSENVMHRIARNYRKANTHAKQSLHWKIATVKPVGPTDYFRK